MAQTTTKQIMMAKKFLKEAHKQSGRPA